MSNVKIKLCGITRKKDYLAAVHLGIDYTGFIFVKDSKRYISPEEVFSITENSPGEYAPAKVGVFADESIETVREYFAIADLSIAQLHGSESAAYCRALGLPFWKVLTSPERISEYAEIRNCPVLIDAADAYERDDASSPLCHALARKAISSGGKIVIAGGISSQNVRSFLQLNPWGVDVCSSVESSPGIKDHHLIEELIAEIRGNSNETQ